MQLLFDASCDARIARRLAESGNGCKRIGTHFPGDLADSEVLAIAVAEERVLVSVDRDFGELVFRHRHNQPGVILLRLSNHPVEFQIARLLEALKSLDEVAKPFVVARESTIRVGVFPATET